MSLTLKDKERFWSKVKMDGPRCWEWTASVGSHGYGQFSFKDHPEAAHRLSFELSYGEIPEGMVVMHSCDNRKCVNPQHLNIGTYRDNASDMLKKGRGGGQFTSETAKPITKLDRNDVLEIREGYAVGERAIDLARKHSVSESCIHDILRGRTWKSVIVLAAVLLSSCAAAVVPDDSWNFYAVSPSRGGFYLKAKDELVKFEDGSGWIAIPLEDFRSFYVNKCEAR